MTRLHEIDIHISLTKQGNYIEIVKDVKSYNTDCRDSKCFKSSANTSVFSWL